jgi:hypothetical protein
MHHFIMLDCAAQKGVNMKKGWKYYLGLSLFIYSFVPIALVFILPFIGFSLAEAGAFAFVLLSTGEIAFLVSVALLGKELLAKLKKKFLSVFRVSSIPKPVSHLRHRFGITLFLISFIPYYATLLYLLFFIHEEAVIKILTWSIVAGEGLGYLSLFILGGHFWERLKDLFRWPGMEYDQ